MKNKHLSAWSTLFNRRTIYGGNRPAFALFLENGLQNVWKKCEKTSIYIIFTISSRSASSGVDFTRTEFMIEHAKGWFIFWEIARAHLRVRFDVKRRRFVRHLCSIQRAEAKKFTTILYIRFRMIVFSSFPFSGAFFRFRFIRRARYKTRRFIRSRRLYAFDRAFLLSFFNSGFRFMCA